MITILLHILHCYLAWPFIWILSFLVLKALFHNQNHPVAVLFAIVYVMSMYYQHIGVVIVSYSIRTHVEVWHYIPFVKSRLLHSLHSLSSKVSPEESLQLDNNLKLIRVFDISINEVIGSNFIFALDVSIAATSKSLAHFLVFKFKFYKLR